MEADLKRIDSMEEDQEVTSRFRAGFTMGELQSSAIPNSVIPSNVRFLSYENMRRIVSYENMRRSFSRYSKASQGNNGPQAAGQ